MFATTRNTLMANTFFLILAHNWGKSTRYIEVIDDTWVFACFTSSCEINSFSCGFDSANNWIWCSKIVNNWAF